MRRFHRSRDQLFDDCSPANTSNVMSRYIWPMAILPRSNTRLPSHVAHSASTCRASECFMKCGSAILENIQQGMLAPADNRPVDVAPPCVPRFSETPPLCRTL
jgi:hypothetical protein